MQIIKIIITLILLSSCSTVGRGLQDVGGNSMRTGIKLAIKCDESKWTRPFIVVPSIFPLIAAGFPVWTVGYFLEDNSVALLR